MNRRARGTLLAGLVATALALTGCDTDVSVEIRPDEIAHIDATLWTWLPQQPEGEPVAEGLCETLSSVPQDHLVHTRLTDPGQPTHVGCHIVGDVPLDDLASRYQFSVVHADERYFFTLPARWIAMSAVDADDMGAESAAPGSVKTAPQGSRPSAFKVAVTFPGPVVDANAGGVIEGNTVRWSDRASGQVNGLRAASLEAGRFPAAALIVPGAGLGLLLGAAGASLVLGRRTRRPTTRDAGPAASDPAAGGDGEQGSGMHAAESTSPETPEVGAEVAHYGVLVTGGEDVEHPEAPAEGEVIGGVQHRAQLGRRRGRRGGALDAPGALHAQVGVDRPARVEAVQDVLAAGDHLAGGAPQGQGRKAGPAQVADGEFGAGEDLV